MNILFAASEAAPYVKTGGLGDVAGALPRALKDRGIEVSVVIPLHEAIPGELKEKFSFVTSFFVNLAWRKQYCGVFKIVHQGVNYYFLDNEYYFKRGESLYGCFDDAERYSFFSLSVLEMINQLEKPVDIIHCNDWQTAMIPVYLKLKLHGRDKLRDIRTLFTIHNIEYQGVFGRDIMEDVLGISINEFNNGFMEHNRAVNFMKSAIHCADKITTVSPTYAMEIQTPEHGFGLDGVLRYESGKLTGIINGIDTSAYNPTKDKHLFNTYSAQTIENKKKNKRKLIKLLNLQQAETSPLIAMVTRLAAHKGLDIMAAAIDELLAEDVMLAILGTGEWKYEQFLRDKQKQYPCKMSVTIAFNDDLARKLYGGADMLLMPSLSEPCGLAQMIALKYGTVPIVRETGGLKDTVVPYNKYTGQGNGFGFGGYNACDMLHVVREALALYKDNKVWEKLVLTGMNSDFSWSYSAKEYVKQYGALIPAKV